MKSGVLQVHFWGWPWRILGAIGTVARAGEPGEIFFVRQIKHDFTDLASANFHKI